MKKQFWIVLAILILATFFRLWDLKNTPPGLWSDEAMNGINTIQANEAGQWKVFYSENFGREGLFINIQALFVREFGHEPWVLRLPSAIFGILTVFGLYLLTKELFASRVALFASFFMATSFWHIDFSRIGFRAIMAPFFLVWGFYLLFLAIRKATKPQVFQDFSQRDGARLSNPPAGGYAGLEKFSGESVFARPDVIIAIAGLIFGLGVHSYIAYRVAPFIALLPLWKFYKDYKKEKLSEDACAPCLIVLFIFMALVAASPLLIYFARNPADFFGRTASISIFSDAQPLGKFSENLVKTLQMFNGFGDFNWRHNYRGASELWWPAGILFLLGIWSSWREKKFAHKFIFLWSVVMLIPVALSSEGLPHALRSIVLLPPAMIFAALGMETVIDKTNARLERWREHFPAKSFQINRIQEELKILIIVFLLAAASNTFNQYFQRWSANPNVYRSFLGEETLVAHWLNSALRNVKKYVVTDSVDTVDITGRPLSLTPIVFITDTYFPDRRQEKNIYYIGKSEFGKIDCRNHCVLIPVESSQKMYAELHNIVPGLKIKAEKGFITLEK